MPLIDGLKYTINFVCRIAGLVETLHWSDPGERALAQRRLEQAHDAAGPLLLKGVVSHWPAVQSWNLENLAAAHGKERGEDLLQYLLPTAADSPASEGSSL